MNLDDVVSKGKLIFNLADTYLQRSKQYNINDPIEALVTFGYQHLEKQEVIQENPGLLDAVRKALAQAYPNFEHNIRQEKQMVVVHGRTKVAED